MSHNATKQEASIDRWKLIADVVTESGHSVSITMSPVPDRDVAEEVLEGFEDQFGLRTAVIHPVEPDEEVVRAAE